MIDSMRPRQHVHYLKASDGTRLAWAESGGGPIIVKAANWLTHLEYEWESPLWKHWIQFFSAHNRLVRYDERGCGMSDWQVGTLSLDQWTADLESIIDAARPAGPVTAGHFAGRRGVHPYCNTASGTRCPSRT
jgi:pimeloyl-ACP methyl ester carboxylesterase